MDYLFVNEDNKKIIDDEVKKKETELALDDSYIKNILELEIDQQWFALRETQDELNDMIRSSVKDLEKENDTSEGTNENNQS